MEWFQSWINQIVLAVIICVIIELLLPENASKKYAKTVIGIYMLFSIFSPIANWIDQQEWENFSVNSVFQEYEETTQTSASLGEGGIENVYEKELEKSISKSLEEMGYQAGVIQIQIKKDGSYALEGLEIEDLEKIEPILEGMPVTEGEKNEIKQMLNESYGIDKEQITLKEKER